MLSNDLVNGVELMLQNPKKALIEMSIPLIISLLITSFYNLIDAAWVSGLGADALAGVGFFTPIFMILVGFGNGLGSGAAFALSKYLGGNNKQKADNAAIHSIIIDLIASLIITLALLVLLNPILNAMGAGQTIGYATDYGMIIILGSAFIILSNALYGISRGEGDTTRPMYAIIASAILNMILDPIFIYNLNLGVKGAAIATIVSSVFVILILLYWFYIKGDTYLKPNLSNFDFKKDISIDIIKVGVPASIQLLNNAFFAAVFSALLTFVGSTDSVAVYSTGWRIVTIGTTPLIAIGTALISVIAANYGAKNYKNIQIVHRYAMKVSIALAIIVAILTNVFAGDISSVFASSGSSVRIAAELTGFLSWIVIYYPTMAVGVASTYVFQGIGKGITAMFQTIIRETGFTITFAVLFAVVLNYGVWGAWMGIVLGEIVSNNLTMLWADYLVKKLIDISG
ncbi:MULTISPECIES: MATE family efflux transporter [Methanobrevibacter]|uniref:Putative MATE family efflux protein n=2 Tax=Methanobrevibacter gottschalkii TaxID=190974 RepID=A0A3N5B2L4_9EURY|nr:MULTISPECIES: MATE family efflux transporter [Methanobrevibacter]OEC98536.1 MATE family efflux transporter [Methanobrevibacter sp. A27]RPF51517.1 putative MATE family efflux protein [Methanobrevibacter gottschalkii DSM 11977]